MNRERFDSMIREAEKYAARAWAWLKSGGLVPDAAASLRPRYAQPALKWAAHAVCLLLPLLQLLMMDYYNCGAGWKQFADHFALHPDTFLFEQLVIYLLFFTLLGLLRRPFLTSCLMTGSALLCSFINYMKIELNGDPFLPGDILLIGRTGELLGFTKDASWPPYFFAFALFFALLLAFVFPVRKRLFIPGRWPVCGALILLLFMGSCAFNHTRSEHILRQFHIGFGATALQSSNYSANGFVGGFALNVLSVYVPSPEGYSRKTVEAVLEPYVSVSGGTESEAGVKEKVTTAGTPASENGARSGTAQKESSEQAPDIILILSESFSDIREVKQLSFSQNPLSNFDSMTADKKCVSGQLYVNAYMGGTVRPEFEILTGLTLDGLPGGLFPYPYVKRDMESCASRYREAGYYTLALHPYDEKFYNRSTAYPHLGFEDFFGYQDMVKRYGDIWKSSQQGRLLDPVFAEIMEKYLEGSGRPCFLYAITMENHQPYPEITNPEQKHLEVRCEDGRLSRDDLSKVNTYANNLYDADQMLGRLRTFIDQRKKPTVLVFFGDHRPNLGDTYASLKTFAGDVEGTTDNEKIYGMPFLIYSNMNLNLEDGILRAGSDNALSAYNLMNAVALATGAEQTPYMRLLEDYYNEEPYYNIRLAESPHTKSAAEDYRAMQLITYDRLFGKQYSLRMEEQK